MLRNLSRVVRRLQYWASDLGAIDVKSGAHVPLLAKSKRSRCRVAAVMLFASIAILIFIKLRVAPLIASHETPLVSRHKPIPADAPVTHEISDFIDTLHTNSDTDLLDDTVEMATLPRVKADLQPRKMVTIDLSDGPLERPPAVESDTGEQSSIAELEAAAIMAGRAMARCLRHQYGVSVSRSLHALRVVMSLSVGRLPNDAIVLVTATNALETGREQWISNRQFEHVHFVLFDAAQLDGTSHIRALVACKRCIRAAITFVYTNIDTLVDIAAVRKEWTTKSRPVAVGEKLTVVNARHSIVNNTLELWLTSATKRPDENLRGLCEYGAMFCNRIRELIEADDAAAVLHTCEKNAVDREECIRELRVPIWRERRNAKRKRQAPPPQVAEDEQLGPLTVAFPD